MEKRVTYHITFWDEDRKIGSVIVESLDTYVIWKLFKQFGEPRTDTITFEVKEIIED